MEQISNLGNGNYFYIDRLQEAQKVFGEDLRANLYTIAKDVKVQVEFNPVWVKSYRLIGYENRVMEQEAFGDDAKDAGELGAGHAVTALYELVPAQGGGALAARDTQLRYQKPLPTNMADGKEWMSIKVRYKPLGSTVSKSINHVVSMEKVSTMPSQTLGFAAAVAGFGLLLRDSPHKGTLTYAQVEAMAKTAMLEDDEDQREFVRLVRAAQLVAQ